MSLQPATSSAPPTLHIVTFASISPSIVAVNNESGSASMLTQASYASNGEECPSGFETPRFDECGGAEQTVGETWNTFHCKGIEAEDYRWKNCFCMHPMNSRPICQWPESSDDESDDGDDKDDSTESDDSEHIAAAIQTGNDSRSTQNQRTDSDGQSPIERSRHDHGTLSYDAESTSNGTDHSTFVKEATTNQQGTEHATAEVDEVETSGRNESLVDAPERQQRVADRERSNARFQPNVSGHERTEDEDLHSDENGCPTCGYLLNCDECGEGELVAGTIEDWFCKGIEEQDNKWKGCECLVWNREACRLGCDESDDEDIMRSFASLPDLPGVPLRN